jgi:hypothetical protein
MGNAATYRDHHTQNRQRNEAMFDDIVLPKLRLKSARELARFYGLKASFVEAYRALL